MTQPKVRRPGRREQDVRAARVHQMLRRVKEQTDEAEESFVNGQRKHDWPAIKDFYLNYLGEIDLITVARQFGIANATLYNRAAKEGWREERVYVQGKLLRDRRAERNIETARRAQEFDDRAYETAKLGMNLVTSRMAQIADQFTVQRLQFERALERAANGETVTKAELWSSINYRELVELGKSLELFQAVGRRALGTDVQTIAMLLEGPDGSPVGDKQASIAEELAQPDPDRLAALVDALVDANLLGLQFDENGNVAGLKGVVIDAEVVEDETEEALLAIEGPASGAAVPEPAP